MLENSNDTTSSPAIIYLKDGKRKHGTLLSNLINNTYLFISNANFSLFQKTNNPAYIEMLPSNLIEAIDIDLK